MDDRYHNPRLAETSLYNWASQSFHTILYEDTTINHLFYLQTCLCIGTYQNISSWNVLSSLTEEAVANLMVEVHCSGLGATSSEVYWALALESANQRVSDNADSI